VIEFAPTLLLLALSLSWPRFFIIFRLETDTTIAQSPLTLVASSVSISCLALALANQGVVTGMVLILTAVLLAHALPKRSTSGALVVSCISLCAYLQFR